MEWILPVVGVVLLSVLVDVLLPKGQTNKYIKGIFGVLLLVALLTPVVQLFRQQSWITDADNLPDSSYQTDDVFIQMIDDKRTSTSRLYQVKARYPTVYQITERPDAEKRLEVYVDGPLPQGLADYVCEVWKVDINGIVIYATG